MFENELQDLRRHKWRVDTPTRALFTADDARQFLHDVGFCLEYPLRAPVVAPTFIGAVIGSDANLPIAKAAFLHPREKEANELKVRLLRERAAFEAGFGEDDNLLIAAEEFPYFYALIGERNPKLPPNPGERGERALLKHAWELIREHGPILETELRERLGEFVSDVALSRTLSELRQKLRIVRIDEEGGAMWDLLVRWSPQVVNQGKQISAPEALSALVAKYLETCIAAEQKDIEAFFGHIVPRSRVADVVKALLAAREFSFIQVNAKTLLRNSPRISEEEKAALKAAQAAPRPKPFGKKPFEKKPWQPRPEAGEQKKNVWEKYGPRKGKFERGPKREERGARSERPWQKRPPGEAAAEARGPRPEWKKKSGADRPWAKPAEGDARRGPRPEWKKNAAGPRDWKKSGPKRPWQKSAAGDVRSDARGPRPEWKKKAAGPRDWKKSGAPRPWTKKPAEGEASTEERPMSADRPFKKSRPSSGFKKSFKKPFQKSSRPGKFGAKPGSSKSGPSKSGSSKFGSSKFGASKFKSRSGKPGFKSGSKPRAKSGPRRSS